MIAVADVMDDRVSTLFADADLPEVPSLGLHSDSATPSIDLPADAGERILEELRTVLGGQRFEMWFDGKTVLHVHADRLTVEAPNAFAANWIRTKFHREMIDAARGVMGAHVGVEVTVGRTPTTTFVPSRVEASDRHGVGRFHSTSAGRTGYAPAGERSAVTTMGTMTGATAGPLLGSPPGALNPGTSGPTMNAKYTLEEFVVGPSNQMAYHAFMQVAQNPGTQFNPLFVHGHCGLGKTHLLQGICHRFAKLHPTRKWIYMTGEQFTNEFLEAIKAHKTDAFRRRIRGAELLVIDDVHFLANKKATQEEFLHTFNQIEGMTGGGKQIVLASDCAPKQIAALSDSLCNRFVSGMVLRVDSPDLPTRLEILRRRVTQNGWKLSDSVLMHVAQSAAGSVRELEGLLLQVVAGTNLIARGTSDGAEILAQIKEQIGDRTAMRGFGGGPVSTERIVDAVANYFGVTTHAVMGSGREKPVCLARSMAMHLARQHTGMSYPEIGRALGGKNHSTVIAACQRVEALIAAGELLCWMMPDGQRHQAIADVLHDLEGAIRRGK